MIYFLATLRTQISVILNISNEGQRFYLTPRYVSCRWTSTNNYPIIGLYKIFFITLPVLLTVLASLFYKHFLF